MKKTILLFGVFLASFAFAQVSISPVSTDTPQATLDIKAMKSTTSPDGILIPRLTRAEALAMNGTIQESTMIYVSDNNTTAGTGTVVDVDTKGFYYFDAAANKWVKVGSSAPGKIVGKVAITSTNYTITSDDYFIKTTGGGGITVTFPTGASEVGRQICVYNESTGNVTLAPPTDFNLGQSPNPYVGNSNGCWIYDGTKWNSTTMF